MLVADAAPAVRLRHGPVEQRVRRLIQVHETGDERSPEHRARDFGDVRAAPPNAQLAHDENVHERDEDRVTDQRRGVRERRAVVRGDGVRLPAEPHAPRRLHDEPEEAGDREHESEQKPRSLLDVGDGPQQERSPSLFR